MSVEAPAQQPLAANLPADTAAMIAEQRALNKESLATQLAVSRMNKEDETAANIAARFGQAQNSIIGNVKQA